MIPEPESFSGSFFRAFEAACGPRSHKGLSQHSTPAGGEDA